MIPYREYVYRNESEEKFMEELRDKYKDRMSSQMKTFAEEYFGEWNTEEPVTISAENTLQQDIHFNEETMKTMKDLLNEATEDNYPNIDWEETEELLQPKRSAQVCRVLDGCQYSNLIGNIYVVTLQRENDTVRISKKDDWGNFYNLRARDVHIYQNKFINLTDARETLQ